MSVEQTVESLLIQDASELTCWDTAIRLGSLVWPKQRNILQNTHQDKIRLWNLSIVMFDLFENLPIKMTNVLLVRLDFQTKLYLMDSGVVCVVVLQCMSKSGTQNYMQHKDKVKHAYNNCKLSQTFTT